MHDFAYHRATSIKDAIAKLKAAADGKYLAGGMTLIPTLKLRLAQPSDLIDIAGIAELRGIKVENGAVTIGALVTHHQVATASDVRARIPALAALAAHIGDSQVRHRGTLGGSLANNDPTADYPAACLGLGAIIRTDRRMIPADDFFKGLFETALEEGEIITAVSFPIPDRVAYMKFPNPASRYALVGAFVARTAGGTRVAITGAGQDGVFRVPAMEAALGRSFASDALAGLAVEAEGLNSDIHASAEYRAHLVGVMARRAVAACG